ncbi:MAG TPA: CBS domain-containing protein [Gaiellaceae bacterium]|nr:CBS domain-containing protein [Gaiellaceae bacterium]
MGVITEADIVLKERAEVARRGWRRFLHPREASALAAKIEARTVGEAMSAPAITAEARWPVAEAAESMLEHGVNRLPVLEAGRLVGIITRHDLVRAFARSDSEIEKDIREEALRGLALTEDLELRVRDGEVTIRGEVDSKYDAESLPDLVRRVPGVVGVDSELRAWDVEKERKVVVTAHRL